VINSDVASVVSDLMFIKDHLNAAREHVIHARTRLIKRESNLSIRVFDRTLNSVVVSLYFREKDFDKYLEAIQGHIDAVLADSMQPLAGE